MSASQRLVIESRIAALDSLRRGAFDQMKPGMSREEERRLVRAAEAYRKEGEQLQAQLVRVAEEENDDGQCL
ncbi:TPA: hypothetical protein VDU83_002509 [Pseudomonas aeruginosa]|nr:hypothetical protein [Pseudomonas aeruginosa]